MLIFSTSELLTELNLRTWTNPVHFFSFADSLKISDRKDTSTSIMNLYVCSEEELGQFKIFSEFLFIDQEHRAQVTNHFFVILGFYSSSPHFLS